MEKTGWLFAGHFKFGMPAGIEIQHRVSTALSRRIFIQNNPIFILLSRVFLRSSFLLFFLDTIAFSSWLVHSQFSRYDQVSSSCRRFGGLQDTARQVLFRLNTLTELLNQNFYFIIWIISSKVFKRRSTLLNKFFQCFLEVLVQVHVPIVIHNLPYLVVTAFV